MYIHQVFLFLILQACPLYCDIVCVYENENENSYRNAINYSDVASITNFPTSNFTVLFLPEKFYLDSVLTIADRQSVTVKGMPSQLICNRSNTGIHIYNVRGLTLKDVTLISCSNKFNGSFQQSETIQFMSSIYIINCTNITIEELAVISSNGSGLVMFDNDGTVNIQNCTFSKSKDNSSGSHNLKKGGSGLHIILSYCGPRTLKNNCTTALAKEIKSSIYIINGCIFNENSAGSEHSERENPKLLAEGFSRGGGLCIIIDTSSSLNSIQVTECNFTENSALWGGGLYLALVGNAHDNIINVSNCIFSNNSCTESRYAGGGAIVGYQKYQDTHPQNNSVNFTSCSFESNRAGIGGGFSFYSSMSIDTPNQMIFMKTNWTKNIAEIGAALNISPQIWKMFVRDSKTKIILSDCRFTSNSLLNDIDSIEMYKTYKKGDGVLFAVGYYIVFQNTITFHDNKASAMYLTSTEVEFCSNVNVSFFRNKGFQGGAICMLGFSALILNDNVIVRFENNSATVEGGAIYQDSFSKRDYFDSQSCFIRYRGHKNVTERNNNFYFQGNTIFDHQNGHSIYLATVLPCYHSCNNTHTDYHNHDSEMFTTCIGNFTFDSKVVEISTSVSNVTMKNETVLAVPGKKFALPIETQNDFLNEILIIYHVMITDDRIKNSIKLDSEYYVSNKSIRFFGSPGDEADVVLESISSRKLVYKFHVKMQQCPPGFVIEDTKCVCPLERPPSIQSCNNKTFEAKLHQNYWMGYENTTSNKNLLYGLCPFTNCARQNGTSLPHDISASLDDVICGEHYQGILCSQCKKDYALRYNDYFYSCQKIHNNCRGWLYVVLEIIPVTIFFMVVMVFNIQFTDGAVSGVILFVQISDTMLIRANGIIFFPQYSTHAGLQIYRFISRVFNLNFFSVDENERLSFCLWESASILDLLAVKYITILYASTLVVVIIALFKYCHSKTVNSILVRIKGGTAASTKSTIIHGVSGFLVICYSECARISFLLLTPATLYNSANNGYVKNVALHNGALPFLRGKHLSYALPAIFIVIAFGVLPPLVLISYPLCYRVLSFLKLGETGFAKLLCTWFPLEKFKPFFDSFQSSFKDEYRFFSGLYFLYRFTTLATFAFSTTYNYYIIVQAQFAAIFTIHAVCQPYKKRWHNILDALLFLNLSLINMITSFNFQYTISATPYDHYINIASTLQVVLLYLPLAYMTIYTVAKTISSAKKTKLGSKVLSLLSRWKSRSSSEPSDYHQLENRLSLSIAEERQLD